MVDARKRQDSKAEVGKRIFASMENLICDPSESLKVGGGRSVLGEKVNECSGNECDGAEDKIEISTCAVYEGRAPCRHPSQPHRSDSATRKS